MNLLRSVRQRRGAASTGSAALVAGYGANLSSPKYYTNVYPFINLLRQGAAQGGTTNAQGWPTNIANGGTAVIAIALSLDSNTGFFPSGSYRVRNLQGMWCTLSSATGCTSVVNGTNAGTQAGRDATFNVTDLGASGVYNIDLRVTVHNDTGSTIATMTDLYVGLDSSLASYTAGEIFSPLFLADLAGIKTLRFSDWNGLNYSQLDSATGLKKFIDLNPALLSTEADLAWSHDYNQGVPYSVCAKLCKKVGCVMWFNADVGEQKEGNYYGAVASTDVFTTYTTDLATPMAHGFVDNDLVALWGYDNAAPAGVAWATAYYIFFVSTTTFKLRLTSGGAAINITADSAASYGKQVAKLPTTARMSAFYDAVVDQIVTAWPQAQVVGQVALENWNNAYARHFDRGVLHTAATGTAGGDAGVGYVWAQLQLWKAIEARFPRNQTVRMLEGQSVDYTPLSSAPSYTDPGFVSAGAVVKTLMDCYAVAPYSYPVEGGVEVAMPSDAAAAWSDAQWLTAMKNGVDIIKPQIIAARDAMLAVAPGMRFISYEGGQSLAKASPTAGNRATTLAFMTWLGTASGGTFAQYFIDQVVNGVGLKAFMQYTAADAWTTDAYCGAWGLKRAHELADSSYAATFKALTIV